LLGVTGRTISEWESGRQPIPYAPYRLLRSLLGGELPGEVWKDFWVCGDRLVTPEGHSLSRTDLSWLSLTFRQAEAFRGLYQQVALQRKNLNHGFFGRVVGARDAANSPWVCGFVGPGRKRADQIKEQSRLL
jgi:hypothetical protein